jgi:hypothetical protein
MDSNSVLPEAANKISKEVTKFQLIRTKIEDPSYGYLKMFPDHMQFLESEACIESVNEVLKIIGRYKETGVDLNMAEFNKDITVLSSHLMYISAKVGELQGMAAHAENIKKIVRSRNIVEAKHIAEEGNLKLTDGEADNLSRVLSEDSYLELAKLDTALRFLSNILFNGKFFCEMLNNVANRYNRELLNSQQ